MKCPSCNKFAALDMEEPEIQTEDFDSDTGAISAEVRIVRKSSCCGEEMKEATFNFDGQVPEETMKEHKGEGHELAVAFSAEGIEEGGSRYARSYFGVKLTVSVECECGAGEIYVFEADDKIAASGMEELC